MKDVHQYHFQFMVEQNLEKQSSTLVKRKNIEREKNSHEESSTLVERENIEREKHSHEDSSILVEREIS